MASIDQQLWQFEKELSILLNDEIISRFNNEVGKDGWVSARGAYISAIHKEFIKRNWDISEIGNNKSLSLKNKVILKNKKLQII